MGIQREYNNVIILGIAIISHKWAESFTLGISFHKANTEKDKLIKLIVLFSIFTPAGIILGMFLADTSIIIEAIALSLSTGIFYFIFLGTFLYVSASEVIVEEFTNTKYGYPKFCLFILGGIMVGSLVLLE